MFRPCIDLHEGRVKQIVGGTLDSGLESLRTNFVSDKPSSWYANLYRQDGLKGGHIIMLGPGNEAAAREALAAYSGGMHVGGGINAGNAITWLEAGASHVIVTSYVFREGRLDWERLRGLVELVGKNRLVLDLSCRLRRASGTSAGGQPELPYFVVTDRWQKFTNLPVNRETLEQLAEHCSEFLVHAVDVEGLCGGIDENLTRLLGEHSPIPTTYAGGAKSLEDLKKVTEISAGKVDLTIGSALDIFGGTGVRYADVVAFNRALEQEKRSA